MNNYTVYHLHSDLSILDSCTKFSDYVNRAKECGMTAIASTEHGLPFEWTEKKMMCDAAGIKFIHGVEIYLTESLEPKVADNYHTVLLAKNEAGKCELNRLIELSTRPDHTYYKNRITFDEFMAISDNIIKISACLAGPLRKLDRSHERYMELAGHYDYYEVQPHNVEEQISYNRWLVRLSQITGVPLIAGTDTHSLSAYKHECRKILQWRKQMYYADEEKMILTWQTYDALVTNFEIQGALSRNAYMTAIENTNVMADSIENFDIDKSYKYPILCGSREADEEELHRLTLEMLDNKLASGVIPKEQEEAFRQDIEIEFDAFHETNMSGFMLAMAEILKWCRGNGIPLGPGRGSVGGSRVAYITDVTDLNPVTYNTNFSRFCNKNRTSLGDIDTDVIDTDRPAIFNHVIELFGENKTARVASFGTIADLAFVDDCGGGLALLWEYDKHPDKFDDHIKFKSSSDYDRANPYHPIKLKDVKEIYKKDPDKAKEKYPDIFKYFEGIVGTRISRSIHPAGMVISCDELDGDWGVFHKDGERCLLLSMDPCHDCNLVKFDFLVLKSLKLINMCCQLAGIKYPRMHEMNFDDQDVWTDMAKNPDGLFQFESEFAAEYYSKYKPKSIYDVSVITAALRPSGASYRDNLVKHIKNHNPTKELDDMMASSLGYMVYQEQTIQFLQQMCGFSGADADSVRRAIAGKQKDKIDKAMPLIIKGYCERSTKPREEAERELTEILKVIEDSSAYSFNYSHAASYSLMTYLCGYYRYHYPLEFITAYLSTAADDSDIATGKHIADYYGIKFTRPCFGQDNRTYYIDRENRTISDSIVAMKGIGLKDAEALYNLSQSKHYDKFVDLLYDMFMTSNALDRSTIKALVACDYFCDFGKAGKLSRIMDEFFDGKNRITKSLKQANALTRLTALAMMEDELPDEEMDVAERIACEIEYIGTPTYVNSALKGCYAVLDVDAKYSPKISLYNIARGTTGVMKMKKNVFNIAPLHPGDIIKFGPYEWVRKPAYGFSEGKPVAKPGVYDMWIESYTKYYPSRT